MQNQLLEMVITFIQALRASLSSHTCVHTSYESVLCFLADEVNNNFALYVQFSSTSSDSLKVQVKHYFKFKSYNSNFCDMLLLIATNTFCI